MAAKYIKVFGDWLETTAMLKPAEKGRLIDALVAYAIGAPCEVSGKVAILFPAFKGQIDRDAENYERMVEGGRRGGRAKPGKAPLSPLNPSQALKTKDKDKDEDKDKDKDLATHAGSSGSAREAAAAGSPDENPFGEPDGSRPSFDTVEVYAANNLAALSPGNMEELAAFKADLPEELIRHAIDEAAGNGKRSWNYVRSILRRYVDAGYKSVGDALAAEAQRRANKLVQFAAPARNYQQHEYRPEDFGDDFYYDPTKDYPEGGPTGPTRASNSEGFAARSRDARAAGGAADMEGGDAG